MTTHTLAAVAAEHLPPDWIDGERWLARRLNRKELRGKKFGRTWVMTDADVAYMLSKYSNEVAEPVEIPAPQPLSVADGLSARSRRRLRSA